MSAARNTPTPIVPGQIWRHHTVPPLFTVRGLRRDGRITLVLPDGSRRHVWPDYMRENFTLYDWPDHA